MNVYASHEKCVSEEAEASAAALELKKKALHHYKAALQCLSLPCGDADVERSELCEELQETITTLNEDIASAAVSPTTEKSATPVTTMGFAGATGPGSCMTSTTTLQIKRKVKSSDASCHKKQKNV